MNDKADRAVPRQLVMIMDAPPLMGLEATERALAVKLLAQLLLEAGGLMAE